jgi:hypothetical protein
MEFEEKTTVTARFPFNSPLMKVQSKTMDEVEDLEGKKEEFVEPILKENPTRFTLFPIMKPKLYQKYKNQECTCLLCGFGWNYSGKSGGSFHE